MNLVEAVQIVGKEAGITQDDARVAIKTFLGIIEEELAVTGKSQVYGLGTFSLFTTKAKKVAEKFNGPRTKLMAPRTVVKFKASEHLNSQVSG